MVVVMVFFPMLVNTVQGLEDTDAMQRDLMRTYAAGYWKTLLKLRLPAAMPFIFNGLKIATTLALIGAIIAEFFGSPIKGMGFRISTSVGQLALDLVWAEIVVAAIAGSAFYGAVALLEKASDILASLATRQIMKHNKPQKRESTMNKLTTTLGLAAAGLWGTVAQAADDVTLQLKWVTQAQFAGYYVAQDQGFYTEEDLNVTIKPGGPDIAPAQVIAGGGADVVLDWMPSALASREKGLALVNIAQPFKSSGMMLTCRKDAGD